MKIGGKTSNLVRSEIKGANLVRSGIAVNFYLRRNQYKRFSNGRKAARKWVILVYARILP